MSRAAGAVVLIFRDCCARTSKALSQYSRFCFIEFISLTNEYVSALSVGLMLDISVEGESGVGGTRLYLAERVSFGCMVEETFVRRREIVIGMIG
jgi:hypothetical protein